MEGPPVRAVADKLAPFRNKRVLTASGNAKIEKERASGQEVEDIFSRGKNLFIRFPNFSLKVHFLMFGSYRVNEEKDGISPRLSLAFNDGVLNFYNCSVRIVGNENMQKLYPEEFDIMSARWNPEKVICLTVQMEAELICDVLLDQGIFAGVGNIIKNEALFMARIHPLSCVGKIPDQKLRKAVRETRVFSMLFYDVVKKGDRLAPKLQIYRKGRCTLCAGKVIWKKTGARQRISFFCPSCQVLHQ